MIIIITSLLQTMARKCSLFVASKHDTASMNIAHHLLKKFKWKSIQESDVDKIVVGAIKDRDEQLYMWIADQPHLHMNYADKLFLDRLKADGESSHASTDLCIRDITFLSRHSAASGTVSLTVHPIGIPWMRDATTSGGFPGRCAPPSPYIAPLYRSILAETKRHGLDSLFQVTLEATHHGPFVEVPACFVEIGSSESEWCNDDAGDIWADCLGNFFELIEENSRESQSYVDSNVEESETAKIEREKAYDIHKPQTKTINIACLVIGGGHYVPKMNDMVTRDIDELLDLPLFKKILIIILKNTGSFRMWLSCWSCFGNLHFGRSFYRPKSYRRFK